LIENKQGTDEHMEMVQRKGMRWQECEQIDWE